MNRGYIHVGKSDNPRDEDASASLFDRIEQDDDDDRAADDDREDVQEEYERESGEEDYEPYAEYDDEA